MILFIIVFGAAICLAGLVILVNPELVLGWFRGRTDGIGLHILAIVVRLILGVFLVVEASVSRYPDVIEILGWLSIFVAIVLLVLGRKNFTSLMTWALSKAKTMGRPAGALAVALGAFLVYAFV